jgi:hypothetical protein
MGTPFYAVTSSPDQEVVAELLPQTRPGPLREADWTQLTAGSYEAANWEQAPTQTLKDLLKNYEDALKIGANNAGCRQAKNCLVDGHGYMIIQDWQEGLKRITFRVIWNGGPPGGQVCQVGAQNEFCQVSYYEQNANYWQKP